MGEKCRAAVLIAEGTEEMEFTVPVDVMRRAGIEVSTVALASGGVTCSRGLRMEADMTFDQWEKPEVDLLVLPGGLPGADHLGADVRVQELLKSHYMAGGWIGAICAAPKILAPLGILEGKHFTMHPGSHADVLPLQPVEERVVVDGRLITGIAAGASFEFALQLVASLCGAEVVREINQGLYVAEETIKELSGI